MAVSLSTEQEAEVREIASRLPDGIGLIELELLERLTSFERNMHALLERLFGEDQAGWNRALALIQGTSADEGAVLNMGVALDQTIRERDAARRAAARFEEAGKPYVAQVIRGLA